MGGNWRNGEKTLKNEKKSKEREGQTEGTWETVDLDPDIKTLSANRLN